MLINYCDVNMSMYKYLIYKVMYAWRFLLIYSLLPMKTI